MKYLPYCLLSAISSSVCMGTIWQMLLIVPLLVPEGRYCYPQILFLWIKKPQYLFPHCNSVIQQLNHFVLPWTFSNSFSSLLRCGGQKCKPSLEEGLLLSTFLSLSLGSAPIIFILDMLPIHSICCPLWSLWAFILFVFFHRSSTLLYLWVFFVLVTV